MHEFDNYGLKKIGGLEMVGLKCMVCGYEMAVDKSLFDKEGQGFVKENMPKCLAKVNSKIEVLKQIGSF